MLEEDVYADALGMSADEASQCDWEAGGNLLPVLRSLSREGHLRPHMSMAMAMFMHDLTQKHGSSQGLVSDLGIKIDQSRRATTPRAIGNVLARDRCLALLDGLRPHERELLKHLILSGESPRSELATWGADRSGYKSRKTQSAFAVGQCISLITTIMNHRYYRPTEK